MRWQPLALLAGVALIVGIVGFFVALSDDRLAYIAERVVVFLFPRRISSSPPSPTSLA